MRAGVKARFISAADLTLQLDAARRQERLKETFNRAVIGPRPLVADEISYLSFGREQAVGRHEVALAVHPKSGRSACRGVPSSSAIPRRRLLRAGRHRWGWSQCWASAS